MNSFERPAAPKKETAETIEKQFANPEKMNIWGEEIDVYDITPETLKTDVPVVIAPGFSATPMAHEQHILALARAGRRVIAIDTPHGLTAPTVMGTTEREFPTIELAKASAIFQALTERGIERADVVAHSEGALYSTIAAHLDRSRFRNMVLVDPAGIIGQDNWYRLVKGRIAEAVATGISEAKREKADTDRMLPKLQSPLIPLKVLAGNLKGTVASIKAMTESDVVGVLKDLRNDGIGISIIAGADDKVFPMEKMQKALGRDAETGELQNAVTGFYSVKGGHDDLFTRPEQYTGAVDAALDALEKRSEATPPPDTSDSL